jgi:hypothetical protein
MGRMKMHYIELAITVAVSVLGSQGLWTFLQSRSARNDAKTKMILGLGHDRIIYLGEKFISRGYVTHAEYENLHDYLYLPYKALGGNGTAEKIMEEVRSLPSEKEATNETD